MARQANDGRGRLGGRAAGTKNRPAPTADEWAQTTLVKHRKEAEAIIEAGGEPAALLLSALALAHAISNMEQSGPDIFGLKNIIER